MKKAIALFLALSMVISLAACSGGSQGTSGNTTPPTNSGAPRNDTNSPSDGPTYHWQVGNVLAADQPWDLGLVKFAELLNEYSGGRMELTVQSGGVLGSEIAMLESVQMGTLDFSICSTPSMSGFVDSQNYLLGLSWMIGWLPTVVPLWKAVVLRGSVILKMAPTW